MPRIVLVEDSPLVQELVAGWLTSAGHEVTTAPNGQEGLELVRRVLPDLVVSDISMPLADGYWLCRELKNAPETAATPIVLLTTRDQPVDILHGLEAGADAFVIKSDSSAELFARVNRLLSGRPVDPAQLAHFTEELVLTHDRRDILKLLFTTLQRQARFDLLAFLLFAPTEAATDAFVTVSPTPLAEETAQRLLEDISATAALLGRSTPSPATLARSEIVVEDQLGPTSFPPHSTAALRIPLQAEGTLSGVLGVFCFAADSDIEEKIRFFFDVATEGARALLRLSVRERDGRHT